MDRIIVEDVRTVGAIEGYRGWPTVAACGDGTLRLVCSGDRQHHMCPFGRIHMMTSRDGGDAWSEPLCLVNTPLDDRDAGICVLPDGTILVTWFNSVAWLLNLLTMPPEAVNRDSWWARTGEINDALIDREIGLWAVRSTDGGETWSSRIDTLVHSPHGPTPLADGRLIYVGRPRVEPGQRGRNGSAMKAGVSLAAAESRDGGLTWRIISEIPAREGDLPGEYHEPHAVETSPGRVVAVIRNHNTRNFHELLQTESLDGGRSWSVPRATDTMGHPGHLLAVQGAVVVSYGIRRRPYGNGVRISPDGGESWSRPLILNDDSPVADLGYPSTAPIGPGRFLTIWYEGRGAGSVLRQARWRIAE